VIERFGEEKADALQELVNLGMGSAGAALASALDAFVELEVPRVELVEPARVQQLLLKGPWADRDFACVRQAFFGGLMGESLMLLHGISHEHLATMLGHEQEISPEIKEEMLLDIANAVMGSCVNGIAEPMNEIVSFAPPSPLGTPGDAKSAVSREISSWRQVLLIDVDFRLEDRRFESRVLVFLSESSVLRIDQALTQLLDGLT
jgi:chemotaxis protein CheC